MHIFGYANFTEAYTVIHLAYKSLYVEYVPTSCNKFFLYGVVLKRVTPMGVSLRNPLAVLTASSLHFGIAHIPQLHCKCWNSFFSQVSFLSDHFIGFSILPSLQ